MSIVSDVRSRRASVSDVSEDDGGRKPRAGARGRGTVSWPWIAARRIGQALLTLFGASLFVWLLFALSPGDPAQRALAARGILSPSSEQLEVMRHELGVDRPWPVQFFDWAVSALQGDFGQSFITQAPVMSEVGARLIPTLRLAGVALVMTTILALALGLIAAAFADRWPDYVVRFWIVICATTPAFISGLLIMQFLVVKLNVGNALASGQWNETLLPGLCLALAAVAVPARVLRGSLIDALHHQYSLVATARGGRVWYVLLRHGLPNALVPFLHAMALTAAWLIGGAVIVEAVFNWPGIGSYLVDEVQNHDLPVVQAITLIATASFILASLCADLASASIEARKGATS